MNGIHDIITFNVVVAAVKFIEHAFDVLQNKNNNNFGGAIYNFITDTTII